MDNRSYPDINEKPSIGEIKLAASREGVNPRLVKCIMDETGNSPDWSAFYALSKGFACKPRFTHTDSCRYADERLRLLDRSENSIYAALMKEDGQACLNGTPISHVRTEGNTVAIGREGYGECLFDKAELAKNPIQEHATIIDRQGTHFSINFEARSPATNSDISKATIESWRENNGLEISQTQLAPDLARNKLPGM